MTISEFFADISDDPEISRDDLTKIILHDAFDCLNGTQQAVIAMDIVGFRQWEIAMILGISRTTVWSKKTQGLAALRNYITGDKGCQEARTDV